MFLILILIFILQTIWLYIKELAGKDLDIIVVIKFIFYFLPKLIPLVLPLTILLSSIMVFGNFAENYEFAAMKSTGISLQRAMSGLSVFIVILGFTTFLFANNVIPWAEFNSYNLRKNIAKLKPAMLLAEGQFNAVEGTPYNIKFAKKTDDNHIEDVVIHIKGGNNRKLATRIKARNGVFIGNEKSEVLKLILSDGNYYNDITKKKTSENKKLPFAKSTFDTYTINIDLSGMNDVDMEDKSLSDRYNMLNLGGLDKAMDSLSQKRQTELNDFSKSLYQRSSIQNLNRHLPDIAKQKQPKKTINLDSLYSGPILDLFDTKAKNQIVNTALNAVNSTKQIITSKEVFIKNENIIYKKHIVSYHEKLALGFACIILFFVGAPLGALIRKGGIGLPMVIAILLFLTYHFIGIFATNSAKSGEFNPILGSWFSTLVMLPLGVYLTIRATADKGLFDMDSIIEPLKKVFKLKERNSVDYTFLNSYKTDQLVDTINNYESLGHDENTRYEAIKVFESRGLSIQDIREQGVAIDKRFDTSKNIIKNYNEHSKFTTVLYSIGVILLVLFFVFRNNKLPSLASASIQLSIISLFLYLIYYIKATLNLFTFYKHINKKAPNIILLILGAPLYMVTFPFNRVKIKELLKLNGLNSLK